MKCVLSVSHLYCLQCTKTQWHMLCVAGLPWPLLLSIKQLPGLEFNDMLLSAVLTTFDMPMHSD